MQSNPPITFKRGEVIKLPLKRKQNRVYLTPDVAHQITPKELQPGVNVSVVTGVLHVKDNLHDIRVLSKDATNAAGKDATGLNRMAPAPTPEELLKKIKYEWGPLDVDLFLKKLQQDGLGGDLRVEQPSPGCVRIVLAAEQTHIQLEEGSTHIVCGGKQSLRLKLRDLLLQCVQKF